MATRSGPRNNTPCCTDPERWESLNVSAYSVTPGHSQRSKGLAPTSTYSPFSELHSRPPTHGSLSDFGSAPECPAWSSAHRDFDPQDTARGTDTVGEDGAVHDDAYECERITHKKTWTVLHGHDASGISSCRSEAGAFSGTRRPARGEGGA